MNAYHDNNAAEAIQRAIPEEISHLDGVDGFVGCDCFWWQWIWQRCGGQGFFDKGFAVIRRNPAGRLGTVFADIWMDKCGAGGVF